MDRPHTTEYSRGWACVETVRSGSREPSYLTPELYTNVRASTTGSRLLVRHGLSGKPEQRQVEALADGVVVTVENGLALFGAPARNDVYRRRFYLGEVRFDAGHTLEVCAEALSVGEVAGGGDHLATIVFLEVAGESAEYCGGCRRDVADSHSFDLPDGAGSEDRGDHLQIRTHLVDRAYEISDFLGACHRLLAHGEEEQVREEQAVGSQKTYYVLGVLVGPGDEHAPLDADRGHRRARAVEDRNAGLETVGDLGALEDVGDERFSREAATAPAAPHG